MSIDSPQESNTDKAVRLAKAIIETIPGAAIGTELLAWFVKLPYQKRLEKWQKDVCDALNELQAQEIDLEKLQNNDDFFDLLLYATQIGIRNHQKEKRDALKNAILNSATGKVSDLSLQQIFLNYIDTFTVWHINILILFDNPERWFKEHNITLPGLSGMGSVRATLAAAYPESRKNESLISSIWTDLYTKGLLSSNNEILVVDMTSNGALASRVTLLGREFIHFITKN